MEVACDCDGYDTGIVYDPDRNLKYLSKGVGLIYAKVNNFRYGFNGIFDNEKWPEACLCADCG